MRDSEIFHARATQCREEAKEAVLENVRERALRAALVWSTMADRSEATEMARDAREARPLHEVSSEVFTAFAAKPSVMYRSRVRSKPMIEEPNKSVNLTGSEEGGADMPAGSGAGEDEGGAPVDGKDGRVKEDQKPTSK